jgi:AcrR family transcriptional regulator
VATLAAGTTVIRAAAAAGIHRTTIHNWLRSSKEFREAVEQARGHYDALVADQLNELSIVALDTLRQLLTSPEVPPAVRLRAALAVLGRPAAFSSGWQLPESVKLIAVGRSEKRA